MNERRRFLHVIGSGAMAVGMNSAGCSAARTAPGGAGSGGGGGGAGGSGTGGSGTGGVKTTSSSTTTATTSTSTGAGCEMSPAGEEIGQPTDYASDGLHIVTDKSVLIGRDAGGLYALTAICTHQGCDMASSSSWGPDGQISGSDIICNCHGSTFSATGAVVQGPAQQPLHALALALGCDGFLYVDTTKTVANTVRLQA
jgi:Rieske Fe-S protein